MDSNIKISILLPAYNAEKTISKSIESILNQSYKNFELIILNDGSTDSTQEIINTYSDPRIVAMENESNIGLINTLNKGFTLSKGTFIARIDADDIWIDVDKLSNQVDFLIKNPNHVLVGTQAIIKNGKGNSQTCYPLSDSEIRKSILSKNPFLHSSIVFKKDVLREIPYRKEDYLVEDYSLWLRLGLLGKFANLPDYSLEYLVNPTGETQKNNLKQTNNSFRLIKEYKCKYPRYYIGYSIWCIKILVRKILFHLK
jgi:glycosyltransferase involved in cell wall biosynthesis